MPPAIAPMQNGTTTDASANAAPKLRRSRVRNTVLRKAKLDPRSTIPNAAIVSGTNSVSVIEAYASGNPVHSTTKQKISHTWLASQTGPIEWSITSRGRSPRVAPPATRSQNPAPKSAPPKTAYSDDGEQQQHGDGGAHRHGHGVSIWGLDVGTARAVRHLVVVHVALAEPPAHLAQDEDRGDRQPDVEHGDDDERDPDTAVFGRCVLDRHLVVDDPRLPADLADDPAGFHRDDRRHAGHRGDA